MGEKCLWAGLCDYTESCERMAGGGGLQAPDQQAKLCQGLCKVKQEAQGSALMCTACVGNGRRNPPATESPVKNKARTGVCVCGQRQGTQGEQRAVLQGPYLAGQHCIYVSICYTDKPFCSSS